MTKKLAKGVNFRKAIATGTTPAEWKKANPIKIKPAPKKK